MKPPDQGGGRRGALNAAAATAVLLVLGVAALVAGIRASDGPPQPGAVSSAAGSTGLEAPSSSSPMPSSNQTTTAVPRSQKLPRGPASSKPAKKRQSPLILSASAPTVLNIPSIGVRSSRFVDLEVARDGTLQVPGKADEIGFYTGGPTPGQLGPAVIGAHVDSVKGPGIFYDLGRVKPGAKVHITRKDGTTTTFVVDKVQVYPKNDFPTEKVYHSDFTKAEIRLVTCGGRFDPVKHYLDNVVVFGHLTSVYVRDRHYSLTVSPTWPSGAGLGTATDGKSRP